ncbi:hypothetical protein [Paenibacillus faecalis]|uniref:hypothetical protein n=1 Tax=Paenibacillus faecalis TaxID=2079532 RepID=UPI000D11071F|nr:hypothetical protein [Paenibacillus faecalis]
MKQPEPDDVVSAEHIPENELNHSYEALYRNIGHWVRQSETITNVPCSNVFEESADMIINERDGMVE